MSAKSAPMLMSTSNGTGKSLKFWNVSASDSERGRASRWRRIWSVSFSTWTPAAVTSSGLVSTYVPRKYQRPDESRIIGRRPATARLKTLRKRVSRW